jgi:hypothetical protein
VETYAPEAVRQVVDPEVANETCELMPTLWTWAA